MNTIPFTRSATFTPFVEFLRQGGASVPVHLAAARIRPEAFGSAESLLPLHQASSFVGRAAKVEGVEDFGLRVGAATPVTDLGLFGVVLSEALTLNDIVHKIVKLTPALDSGARAWLQATGENTVELRLRHEAEDGRAQVDAYALMLLIGSVRLAAGPEWRPGEVALDSAAGRLAGRHEALSAAAVRGEVNYVAVSFERDLLGLPVRRDEGAKGLDAERELIATAPPADFAKSMEQAIRGSLWSGALTIEEAAEMAGTSVRSLQRRLAEGGVAYNELIDRARFHEAIPMLENPRMKLSEIAGHLGYSDPANFTRAFRRWTASAPGEFRRARSLAKA